VSVAVYPGTFDPITYGHIDVAERAAAVFDELIMLVMNNRAKAQTMFSVKEREKMIRTVFSSIPNIRVESYHGLLVDYAQLKGHHIIIRGLRAVSDFEYEMQMAAANRKMYPKFDTFFLMTDTKFSFISSSLVKEIALNGGSIDPWVPESVKKEIIGKIAK
jgi:pantetheine-phosphate adenylyltransferase